MLAFAGSNVFRIISEGGKNKSHFLKVISAFYHFIFMQTISILLGLLCKVYNNIYISALGYTMMIYAVVVTLATAAQLFNTARIANEAASLTDDEIAALSVPSADATPDA